MARSEREQNGDRPFRHEGHRKPVTRREFLAQGFLTGSAMVMSPSLFGFLRGRGEAHAQACGISSGAGKIPFVCFDLAGGANIAGSNVLVGGPGGQQDLISDNGYLKLGIPVTQSPRLAGQINTELGVAFHADSAFLRGIIDMTTPETRAKVNGVVLCARSENDTGNNPHNPMYGINKAGADGDLVTLVGTESSESGGNSVAPMSMIDPAVRPVKIDRPRDVTGLVDTGKLVDLLDQDDAAAVMAAVERISELKLARMTESAIVEDLIRCGYVESTNLVATFGNPAALDPLNDPLIVDPVTGVFATPGDVNGRSEFRKTAAIMKLVVNGFAGAGTIEFGGYDYHDSSRATGERKDFVAGQAMGAVLEYAAKVGQQLMLYVLSDGSVACDGQLDESTDGRGKGIWKADNSGTSAGLILVYDPTAVDRPLVTNPGQQIGWFRMDGSGETGATRISNNVVQLAEAVVLNYLALHDEAGMLDAVLPGHGLGSGAERDALIGFQPIR